MCHRDGRPLIMNAVLPRNYFYLVITSLIGYVCSQGPSVTVKAILNGTASLPCNINPPTRTDSVILVVWYRNELRPIYSFDVRTSSPRSDVHWKDKTRLGERAHFRTVQTPAVLAINNVRDTDEGEYRCRVDFSKSPTRNSKVFLTVIVPPQKPIIMDTGGHEVASVVGPFVEGSDVRLICKVRGGRPAPFIRWSKESVWLESSEIASETENDVKQREVIVRNLNRTDLNKSLLCEASNNNISAPLSSRVYLDVYFKASNVTILDSNESLSAGREHKKLCVAVDSRPFSTITWWLNNEPLPASSYAEQIFDKNTTSVLTFTPTQSDHNKTLTCRAENPKMDKNVLQADAVIDVTFPPVLKLDLGSEFNPRDIEEGDDVYFECKVTANPPAYKIEWLHNDALIPSSLKNVLIVNHRTLILQKIRRQMAGNYSCSGSSVEGDGKSNTVHLQVMYRPICKPYQKYIYGVAKEENAQVVCEVDAFPEPETFKWLFNHTAKPIPEARYSLADNRRESSLLTFSPQSDLDYGILMCSASNAVGLQLEPCIFHIIPAGLPEPPYNCTVNNQTSDSVDVTCREGFDNGQKQTFLVEVTNVDTKSLLRNMSTAKLHFKISGVAAGTPLRMNIYAVNSKGRSDSVVVETFTLETALKQTGDASSAKLAPLLAVLIGLGAISSVFGLVALCVLRSHTHSSSRTRYMNANGGPAEKAHCISKVDGYEVKSTPDVIQCNSKGKEYSAVRISGESLPKSTPCPNDKPSDKYAVDSLNIIRPDSALSTSIFTSNQAAEENTIHFLESTSPSAISEVASSKMVFGHGYTSSLRERAAPRHTVGQTECALTSIGPHHREVITIRTPLPLHEQESCV